MSSSSATSVESSQGPRSRSEQRKSQNRINARQYRNRKRLERQVGPETLRFVIMVPSEELVPLRHSTIVSRDAGLLPNSYQVSGICAHRDQGLDPYLKALHHRLLQLPKDDLLLTLISFNVCRAFSANMRLLEYNYAMLIDYGAVSPFVTGRAKRTLPENFRPTGLQKAVPHHPVFDVFPDPRLREGMILAVGSLEAVEVCWDILGMPSASKDMHSGLLVWGEPHLIESWEVSQEFFKKHSALLTPCRQLVASTNKWRACRGEEPLIFDIDQ